MNQLCLQINEQVFIPLLIFILITTITALGYLFKTYQLRQWNPIQELSPLLTIFQGLSLLLFINISIIVIIEDSKNQFQTIKILMIFQNYFRGLFIYITIFKSLRITLAFQLNPNSIQIMKKICYSLFKSEIRILIVSILSTVVLWTGIFDLLQYSSGSFENKDNESDLLQYETVNNVEAINNFVEILLSLIIIYYNQQIEILQFDTLKQYINKPLIIYSIWLFINSFLSYLIHNDDCILEGNQSIPITFLIMLFSQILRSIVEFYYIVCKPILNSTFIRLPLIPSVVLENFQLFMRIPICSTVFYDYIKQLETPIKRINHSNSQEFADDLQVLEAWMLFQMKLENGGQVDSYFFTDISKKVSETQYFMNSQEQIQIRLERHLKSLFKEYKQTKSYYQLQLMFQCLDNATRIQNNRFHQKVLQSRINTESNYQLPKKRHRNQYYEKWLQQKQLESNISTETCLDTITPNLPQAKIPNSFEVKLIKDILSKNS